MLRIDQFTSFLLEYLEVAILIRLSDNLYTFWGTPPLFYTYFFPARADGGPCVTPWIYSKKFNTFYKQAEEFFAQEKVGGISSGIWYHERDKENAFPLLSSAQYIHCSATVVIHNVSHIIASCSENRETLPEIQLDQKAFEHFATPPSPRNDLNPHSALYTKKTFLRLAQFAMSQKNTPGKDLAIFLIAIDHFDQIHKKYSADIGNEILRTLGQLFRHGFRSEDLTGHYKKTEFIICSTVFDINQAKKLAEKIRLRIEDSDFPIAEPLTVSIGGTLLKPYESLERCIERADQHLFRAKRSGKNRNCIE